MKKLLSLYLLWAGFRLGVIAQGVNKQTIIKKQAGLGSPASGAGGQILRRETSTFALTKGSHESNEITSHQQDMGKRHGAHSTTGKVSGLLSPSTYKLFMAAIMRKDFVAGVSSGALINVTAASTGTATGTFTRAAGSWITDGFRRGDVIRWTGWAGGSATNNNTKNMLITGLTATVMTVITCDQSAVVADAAGDSVTASVVGKKTLAPLTGHTDDLFTVEEWYPDVARSEAFIDVRVAQGDFDIPGNGNCKIDWDLPGLRRSRTGAQVLTTPAVETVTDVLQAATGVLMINGSQSLVTTSLKLTINGSYSEFDPVVGSKYRPNAGRGTIKVSGSFSAYFESDNLSALYEDETVLSLYVVACTDTTPAADFIGFSLGRLKLDGDAPDDGMKGIVRQCPFTAEINKAGGAGLADDQTILSVQDSQA